MKSDEGKESTGVKPQTRGQTKPSNSQRASGSRSQERSKPATHRAPQASVSQGCLADCVTDCVAIQQLTAYRDCVEFCGRTCKNKKWSKSNDVLTSRRWYPAVIWRYCAGVDRGDNRPFGPLRSRWFDGREITTKDCMLSSFSAQPTASFLLSGQRFVIKRLLIYYLIRNIFCKTHSNTILELISIWEWCIGFQNCNKWRARP